MVVSNEENQNVQEFVARLSRIVVTHVPIDVPNVKMVDTFARKNVNDFYFVVMSVDVLVILGRTVHRVKRNVLLDVSIRFVPKCHGLVSLWWIDPCSILFHRC